MSGVIQLMAGGFAADDEPASYTYTDVTGQNPSTVVTSNSITVSDINVAIPITITGGTYSINGGGFTSSAGTVTKDDTVRVQVTTSSSFSTGVSATTTIGGIQDTFTATTRAGSSTLLASNAALSGGGIHNGDCTGGNFYTRVYCSTSGIAHKIDLSVREQGISGCTVRLMNGSSSAPSSAVSGGSVGGVSSGTHTTKTVTFSGGAMTAGNYYWIHIYGGTWGMYYRPVSGNQAGYYNSALVPTYTIGNAFYMYT